MDYKEFYYNRRDISVHLKTIQIFRRILGVTQKEIADATGLSREAVSNWEHGHTIYNFEIQKWYIEHGLLEFNEKFTSLLYDCELMKVFKAR